MQGLEASWSLKGKNCLQCRKDAMRKCRFDPASARDPPGGGDGNRFSILAWNSDGKRFMGQQFRGPQRVEHDWACPTNENAGFYRWHTWFNGIRLEKTPTPEKLWKNNMFTCGIKQSHAQSKFCNNAFYLHIKTTYRFADSDIERVFKIQNSKCNAY